jgi:hypothetical protein
VGIPGTEPNQSILTTNSPRVVNSTSGETEYSLTARDGLRFGGNYGIIRGIEDEFLDGTQYSLTAGYDHRMDAGNTLGVTYSYSAYSGSNGQETGRTNSAGLSYSRRITGRVSAQGYAGAQFVHFAQNGSAIDQLSWGASGSLSYHRTHNSVSLQFYRGVSGGSGVFAGAKTTTVGGGLSHTFSPRFTGSVNGGYGRNEQLQQSSQNSNSVYFGAQASRSLTRDASLYFGYSLQWQVLSSSVVSPVAFNGRQHSFSVGINWSHQIRIAR